MNLFPESTYSEPSLSNVELDELRTELEQVKASTVSKEAFDDLKNEVKDLREQIQNIRKHFEKKIVALMHEIDEEKKLRYQAHVEMERVRRLVANMDSETWARIGQ